MNQFIGSQTPSIVRARATLGTQPKNPNIYRGIVVGVDATGGHLFEGCPPNTVLAIIPQWDPTDEILCQIQEDRIFVPEHPNVCVRKGDEIVVSRPSDGSGGTYTVATDVLYGNLSAEIRRLPVGFTQVDQATAPVNEPDVPRYRRRGGDVVHEGINNAVLVLTRDRHDTTDSGYLFRAGTIIGSVGRVSEDLNFRDDAASLIISQMTDIDNRLQIELIPGDFRETQTSDDFGHESSAVGLRAAHVRLSARESIKLQTDGIVTGSDGQPESTPNQGTIVVTKTGQILLDNRVAQVDLDPASGSEQIVVTHKTAEVIFTVAADSSVTLDSRKNKTKITIDKDGNLTIDNPETITFKNPKKVYFGEGGDQVFALKSELDDLRAKYDGHKHPGSTLTTTATVGTGGPGAIAGNTDVPDSLSSDLPGTGGTSPKIYVKK